MKSTYTDDSIKANNCEAKTNNRKAEKEIEISIIPARNAKNNTQLH